MTKKVVELGPSRLRNHHHDLHMDGFPRDTLS